MCNWGIVDEQGCTKHYAGRQEHGHTMFNPAHADTVYDHAGICSKSKTAWAASQQMHCLLVLRGLDSVSKFADHAVRSFAMCGNLVDAGRVFSKILKPTSYTWTAIILAHCKLGHTDDVFKLYEKAGQEGLAPSKIVYSSILKACNINKAVDQGKLIHSNSVKSGFELDPILTSMLVNMYIKFGSLEDASNVFNALPYHDVVSWGTMIAGYTQHGKGVQAIEAFNKMQIEGVLPDEITYSCILKACGSINAAEIGKLIHSEIIKGGMEFDVVVGNTLVDMYICCGSLVEARYLFDCLSNRNLVSWSTMIAGYVQHGHDVQALVLFKKMQELGVYTGSVTVLFALKACCNIRSIEEGGALHGSIVGHGFDADVAIGSVLLDMYGKAGSLDEAQAVFDSLPARNVYSWNAMIKGYTSAGLCHYALHLFDKMREEGVKPDKATFSCMLTACASLEALREGRLLHDQVLKWNLSSDVVIMNTLLDMYAKCGDFLSVKKVFDKSNIRDIGIWGILIAGYAQHGDGLHALEAFVEMQSKGLKPNKIILVSVLKACGLMKDVLNGSIIHDQIIRSGFELDVIIGNTLVDMYAKCGNIVEADQVFQTLSDRDVISWNAMIVGFVHHGHYQCAIELFDKMQQEGLMPDRVTFSCILKACSSLGALDDGRLIHEKLVRDGFQPSMVVGSTLIDMYAKCGSLEEARDLFEQLPSRGLVSWGAMITGYALQGNNFEAINLFWKMISEGLQPDQVLLLSVLKACCSIGALVQGKLVHMEVVKNNFDADMAVGAILVHMYAKFGHLEDAERLFNDMRSKNIAVWNAMVGGYAQHSDWRQAKQCLVALQTEGIRPVGTTYTNVLAACSHGGQVAAAHESFQVITEADDRDSEVQHLNCFVDVLGRTGCLNEAGKMLCSMPILPSIISWMSLLTACKTYGQHDLGMACFYQIVELDPNAAAGYTIMSNIYADAQKWEDFYATQELRRCVGAWKLPGKAWIEVNNELSEFVVEDNLHRESVQLLPVLKHMFTLAKAEGYVPRLDLTFKNIKFEMIGHY